MIFGMDFFIVLVAILILVLIWRGPKTLPGIGAMFGRGVKTIRDEVSDKLDDGQPPPGA